MKKVNIEKNKNLSFDEYDNQLNENADRESDFSKIVNETISRRGFVDTSFKFGLMALVFNLTPKSFFAQNKSAKLSFSPVKANTEDTITVPQEYTWDTVVSWGDPLWSKGKKFNQKTRGTGSSQELAFGDNNDGMAIFFKNGVYVLAVNNEYTNNNISHGNRKSGLPETNDDVRKGMAAHGVSVFEIKENRGKWQVVKDSPYNRRITATSEMTITGPLKGYDKLKTKADPKATRARGTWNNCGNGVTPWNTYLACEENFNGYFSSSDANYQPTAEMKRYGVSNQDWGYAWGKYNEQFDISKNPNEVNKAGYIVEVDPFNPSSTPKKLTALGRFKHENADVVIAKNGKVVVYMGDDERGEFLYKYVSDKKYKANGNNDDLLQKGTLYVAKFHNNGKGEWLALTPKTTGMTKEEICLHTRMAGSKVKATTMDRPEWVASNPKKVESYCCLTNNKNRGIKPNKGGDNTPVGGPNPREKNLYGQIVRWIPQGKDHSATKFDWDLFVLAGNPTVHNDKRAGSKNINADNMFNSPDGLAFDNKGLIWIQTDGKYSNTGDFAGMGNNQMLIGDPATGEIKRFLTGPKSCEVTGITFSPDNKTVFVGIQHPGEDLEKNPSHFPDGGNSVPRSSIVAISRKDKKIII